MLTLDAVVGLQSASWTADAHSCPSVCRAMKKLLLIICLLSGLPSVAVKEGKSGGVCGVRGEWRGCHSVDAATMPASAMEAKQLGAVS